MSRRLKPGTKERCFPTTTISATMTATNLTTMTAAKERLLIVKERLLMATTTATNLTTMTAAKERLLTATTQTHIGALTTIKEHRLMAPTAVHPWATQERLPTAAAATTCQPPTTTVLHPMAATKGRLARVTRTTATTEERAPKATKERLKTVTRNEARSGRTTSDREPTCAAHSTKPWTRRTTAGPTFLQCNYSSAGRA